MSLPDIQKLSIQGLLLGAGLVILAYTILNSGIINNVRIILGANILLLLAAFCFSIGNILIKVYRWKYLSSKYDLDLSWYESALVSISSFFFANITPGKIGDVYKAYFMKEKYSLCYPDGASMLFYERFFELAILFVFAALMVFIEIQQSLLIVLGVSLLLLVALGLFFMKASSFADLIQRLIVKIPSFSKNELCRINIRKLSIVPVTAVFFITLISLVFEFLRLWCIALAFGFYMHPLSAATFFSLSIIAGLVSQIPLGIGITEGSLSYLITQTGCDTVTSMAIVLTDRLLSMYFALLLGIIFSRFSMKELREVKNDLDCSSPLQ